MRQYFKVYFQLKGDTEWAEKVQQGIEGLDPFAVYRKTSAAQINLHLSGAIKRVPQELFIDKTHEFQVVRPFGKRRSGSVV